MKPIRNFSLAFIGVLVGLTFLTLLPVSGAVDTSAAALKSSLEAKYGLELTGDGNLLSGKDAVNYLGAYDKAMSLFGAPFIKELVAIYQKTGETPKVKFSKYTGKDDEDAFYDWGDEGMVIGLMVESPYPGKPTLGLAPQTVTHEIGHMIYYGICEKYGEVKFGKDWTAVNKGNPYREGDSYLDWEDAEDESDSSVQAVPADEYEADENNWDEEADYSYIYVSDYAATDAFEDFAEIIASILTEPEQVRKLTGDRRGAVLKAKVDFIEKTLKKYFTTFKGYPSWGYTGEVTQTPTTHNPTGVPMTPTPTGISPDEKSDSASAYQSKLETKYGMKITGDGNLLTGKDAMSYLTAYDKAMSLFGAPFIKELVGMFEAEGVTTSIRFRKDKPNSDEEAAYDWNDDQAVIELRVESPYSGKPTLGLDPQTITHEVGHMIYYGISLKYNEVKLERDWTAVNKGTPYGEFDEEEYRKYQYVYITDYAATDAVEDFAEIIAFIMTDPDELRERAADSKGALLKAKIDYIEKLMKKYYTTFKGLAAWGYTVITTVPKRNLAA